MTAVLPRRPLTFLLAACAFGIVCGWAMWAPWGLMAPAVMTLAIAAGAPASVQEDAKQAMKIIASMPAHTWSSTPDGRITHVSASLFAYIGETPPGAALFHEMDNRGWRRVMHPDDYDRVIDTRRRALKAGAPFDSEYRVRGADGAYRWFRCFGSASRDEQGRISGWYGTLTDIEEQKRAQEALRRSERQLQQLIDTVPALMWSTTHEGKPTYVSKPFTEVTGATLKDITAPDGSPDVRVIHPDYKLAAEEALRRSIRTGAPYIQRYPQIRVDGRYRWTETRAAPLRDESGAIIQWYGVSTDIHDLVSAQTALRERERELSLLIDMVPSYLWRLSPEGEPNFFNRRLREFLGLSADHVDEPGSSQLASLLKTVVHPDDVEILWNALSRSIDSGERFAMRYRLRRADGVYRWVDGAAEPLRDENDRIVQWYGLSHDIDDQLHVEEALRESERAARQLVETLPAMIDCASPDGEPIYRSRQLRDFLGYDIKDLDEAGKPRLAGTLDAGVHPDDLAGVKARYARSLSTGEPYMRKHRLRRFDGEYRWVETRAAAMRDAGGAIVQWNVICMDIDREVRAQEELRQARESLARASQAASLAELSASIAHEVNQPLAAIVANSHACQRWLTAAPPNIERAQITVERMIRDAKSAADVVSRIRALFSQSTEARCPTPFANLARQACALMEDEADRRRIRMEIEIESGLPPVSLDRVQVQQVLVNLIRNGLEAMDQAEGERVLLMRMRRNGDAVRTEVSDSGPGMEAPEKAFQPFFTTKGDGMGMGLAICRSIVEAHGGRLWVEANEPRGARFVFDLPLETEGAT